MRASHRTGFPGRGCFPDDSAAPIAQQPLEMVGQSRGAARVAVRTHVAPESGQGSRIDSQERDAHPDRAPVFVARLAGPRSAGVGFVRKVLDQLAEQDHAILQTDPWNRERLGFVRAYPTSSSCCKVRLSLLPQEDDHPAGERRAASAGGWRMGQAICFQFLKGGVALAHYMTRAQP